ncbi:MAG: hypothetical protein COX29_02220 [Candidatus Moranbacteria bacterium CG23_combo_of_CG06-09_8_20_14_all_35_22]|nr:MAG: hypothetical protein COX29_02220 [Candidatus Moranbacteria bacterium CG23_combo_of_CG06-09_8_20_14_all_35_22]
MKIVICGSMIFSKEMIEIGNELTDAGHEIVLPRHSEKYAKLGISDNEIGESAKNKIESNLIQDYFEKIKNSDAILAVNYDKNGIKNYIGGNTFLEMGFAHVLNKKIYLLNPIPEMGYEDEIVAMQPIILNGDLKNIL